MRKIFSLLLVAAGMLCSIQSAQAVVMPAGTKAYGYAQFGQGANPVWADAAVYNDYHAALRLPNEDAKVKLTDTIYADVFTGSRHKSFTYNAGIVLPNVQSFPEWQKCAELLNPEAVEACHATVEAAFNDSIQKRVTVSFGKAAEGTGVTLKNFYSFTSASVNVNVITKDDTKSFNYSLTGADLDVENDGINERVLTATPNAKSAVVDAINLVKTKCTKGTATTTQAVVKSGSFIQYGEEKMSFISDMVITKNDKTMDKLLRALSESTVINKPGISGSDTCKATIFLIAGSVIEARGQYMRLDNDMTISIDASFNTKAVNNTLLSTLKKYADANNRIDFFRTLVSWANLMADKIEGKMVTADVTFYEEEDIPWTVIRGENSLYVESDGSVKGKIGTFCVPFAIQQLRGARVFSIESRDAATAEETHTVTLVEVGTPLKKAVPYVFYGLNDSVEVLIDEDETWSDLNGTTDPALANGLIGYYSDDEPYYTITPSAANCVIKNNMLYRVGSNVTLRSGTAYISLDDIQTVTGTTNVAAPRRMQVGKQNVSTDLEMNEVSAVTKTIENGELIIIKNGVKYNAQGLVK